MVGQIDFKFMMSLFLFFSKYYDILCLLWAKAHRGSKQKMNSSEKVNFWNLQFQLPQMTYFVCSTPCCKSYKNFIVCAFLTFLAFVVQWKWYKMARYKYHCAYKTGYDPTFVTLSFIQWQIFHISNLTRSGFDAQGSPFQDNLLPMKLW